eukprot:CAMPEP_0181304542 /NCGR_PEP_ID=MMETSP1101-20121128/9212_1 /TAXON_ID=46948 /ORGANISM="Rhodomonas abbreviata, Strain Caron Lab Isolate" /LENGTH=283 /DNA_ID=CAMNT_0023410319 /DNA_START=62 /DNA_END=913 /DNA_ORIENTATION=-
MLRSIVLCLGLLSAVAALVQHPHAVSVSAPRSAPLRLRGGLGDIDPNLVAKIALGPGFANAALCSLAPSKAGEVYGVTLSAISEWITESSGYMLLGAFLLALLTLTGKTSLAHAAAWSIVPGTVGCVKALLNNTPQKCGVAVGGQYFGLAVNAAVTYALFTVKAATATNVIKGWAAWGLLNGIGLWLMPEGAGKAWGCPSLTELDALMFKVFGVNLIYYAVLLLGLAQGKAPAQAIGYSLIPFTIHMVDSAFISKTNQKFGLANGPNYFWMVFMVVVIAGTLA